MIHSLFAPLNRSVMTTYCKELTMQYSLMWNCCSAILRLLLTTLERSCTCAERKISSARHCSLLKLATVNLAAAVAEKQSQKLMFVWTASTGDFLYLLKIQRVMKQ